MKTLELRGGEIIKGDLCAPKGFHLYCNASSGLLLCDGFATVAYQTAGSYLRGYSTRIAKVGGGKQTVRAVLLSNCAGDVLQRDSRERAIKRVNYASDRLGVPASELRPMFIGNTIDKAEDEKALESIKECAKALRSSQSTNLEPFGVQTYLCTVRFYLGDDYSCTLSGAIFTDKTAPMTKRSILLTTDVAIDAGYLQKALSAEIRDTIGLWPVPPSANDGYMILSSGLAGNNKIADRDVEFTKFTKALTFVLRELSSMALAKGDESSIIELNVVGAQSKHLASDVVNNAYVYFSMSDTETCCLLRGLISCIGGVDSLVRRSRLRIWLESDCERILLTDRGRILYVNTVATDRILSMNSVKITIDFQDGNYSALGWIPKRNRKIFDF